MSIDVDPATDIFDLNSKPKKDIKNPIIKAEFASPNHLSLVNCVVSEFSSAFIFSFMPLTFWQMGHPSTNCLRAAFTLVASPRSFAHLVPHVTNNFL